MGIKKMIRIAAETVFQSNWYPNKKILLESIPDMSCQTYPVFQEMLKRGLNNEYKLIWLVTDKRDYKDVRIKNVRFMNIAPRNGFEKIQKLYTLCTSRAMLYAKRYIGKIFDKQLFVYLIHGTSLKSRLKHCRENEINECDLVISLSPFFITPEDDEELHMEHGDYLVSGYPRNDYLFEKNNYIKVVYPDHAYQKVIIWMPTFRKNKQGDRVDSSFNFPLGIPCVYTVEQLNALDDYLKSKNVLLVLKPHPAQDVGTFTKINCSNIKLLEDAEIAAWGIQLYQFIGSTDALITDYSSVYYDYLLTGKPIGITIDDFDTYARETGFVFDNILDLLVGFHIKNYEELCKFIASVSEENDAFGERRNEAAKMFHKYVDNLSSQRVVDRICSELKNRYYNRRDRCSVFKIAKKAWSWAIWGLINLFQMSTTKI